MKNNVVLILAFITTIFSACAQQEDTYKILEVQTYKDSITNGTVQLVDVRTPEEYSEGHIEYAKNIDFFSEDFEDQFNKLDKNQPVYIYCKSGNRSGKAGKKLKDMGFHHIYDLKGGILNYK